MTKVTYMSKIGSNQSIGIKVKEEKEVRIKKLKTPKAFIDYSQVIDVY